MPRDGRSTGYPGVIAGRTEDNVPVDLACDDDGNLIAILKSWDSDSLSYQRFSLSHDLLKTLVTQIRIMNMHLAVLTGQEIKAHDIEPEI